MIIDELWEKAHAGDRKAQEEICFCTLHGLYGFERDPHKLIVLAEEGWVEAQAYVCRWLQEGWFGFDKNVAQVKELKKKFDIE